jgi:hypothetical protein
MNTITNFWKHFHQNNFVFLLLNEIPKDELKIHFDKLIEILHLYNKDLDLIIKNKRKEAELIVTANGNPYLFKEVELLVYHAPEIKRWKITALLQPQIDIDKYASGKDKPIEYYGISLRISEMYFIPLAKRENPTDLGIKVLIKNHIIYKENPKLREAVYQLIEQLVGEKSFANDLAFIDIDQLKSEDFEDECLLELYNLKFFIDSFE